MNTIYNFLLNKFNTGEKFFIENFISDAKRNINYLKAKEKYQLEIKNHSRNHSYHREMKKNNCSLILTAEDRHFCTSFTIFKFFGDYQLKLRFFYTITSAKDFFIQENFIDVDLTLKNDDTENGIFFRYKISEDGDIEDFSEHRNGLYKNKDALMVKDFEVFTQEKLIKALLKSFFDLENFSSIVYLNEDINVEGNIAVEAILNLIMESQK